MKNIKFLLFALILISQGIAQNGAWYQISDALGTLKRGCAITWGGNDTLYALRGYYSTSNQRTFYAYIISQNLWITRANTLANVDTGAAITRVRNCSLYAFTGKTASNFYLYRTDLNQWIPRNSAPGSILPGATLCWAGGDTIYAFKGGWTQTFYKYIISTASWITASNIPKVAHYGAGMCYAGVNAKFYAIFGGNDSGFYLYNPQVNPPWVQKASPGIGFQQGASLTWDGGTTIYAVVGGGSTSAFMYDITSNTWSSMPSTPDGIGGSKEGAGLLAWDNRSGQKQLYLIQGDGTKYFYRFCLPLSSQPPLAEGFDQIQFPPAGWQAKLEQGTDIIDHNWQRTTTFPSTPYTNTAVAAHMPSGDTRRRAKLITPKLYLGPRPALVKVSFYMFYNSVGIYDDTLLLEYYKVPSYYNPQIATFSRKDTSGWVRREVMFVETDTIMIAFHGINQEGDDYAELYIDSISISIDTANLYSNTFKATASNQSNFLARKPETEILHTIYQSAILDTSGLPDGRALLYYTYSRNYGENWSSPYLIDTVYQKYDILSSASIAISIFNTNQPWIAYIKPTGPQFAPQEIWTAVQRANGTWNKKCLKTTTGEWLGLSMAMGLTQGQAGEPDLAYVVTRALTAQGTADRIVFFAFDTITTYSDTQFPHLVPPAHWYTPSIAVSPYDYIHIAYNYYAGYIYYRTILSSTNNYLTRTQSLTWSNQYRVSQYDANTEPASYPSVETYGNLVFVAWRGKNESGQNIGEIWRRKGLIQPGQLPYWYAPQNMSQSPSRESHYPVMSSSQVTAFQESTAARNKEVYANFWDNYFVNISETDSFSFFPHIDVEARDDQRPPYALPVNTIWTERLSSSAYEVKFRRYIYPAEEKLSYYRIETGDSVASPYCLQRDGFIPYQQLPIDFGNQKTVYELPYLHPLYHHKIKAVVYHGAQGRFKQNFAIDSIPLGSIEYEPNIAETIEIEIPKNCYQIDSRAILEITKNRGQFVTLAKPLVVYQYEVPETTSSSGPQSAGQITVLTKPRLYQNYPNPFKTQTAIRYSLPTESKVLLRIYNISGRLVKTLINQHQTSNIYSVTWDGKDNLGKTVSSGIYFYRLETDNYQTTNRAIIIR